MYFESWKHMFLRRSLAQYKYIYFCRSMYRGLAPPPPITKKLATLLYYRTCRDSASRGGVSGISKLGVGEGTRLGYVQQTKMWWRWMKRRQHNDHNKIAHLSDCKNDIHEAIISTSGRRSCRILPGDQGNTLMRAISLIAAGFTTRML